MSKNNNIDFIGMEEDEETKSADVEVVRKKGQFVKGYDPKRNLAGRPPKGRALSEKARNILKSPDPIDPNMLVEDRILLNITESAINGDLQASQVIMNRAYGRDVTPIDIGKTEEPEMNLATLDDNELKMFLILLQKVYGIEPDEIKHYGITEEEIYNNTRKELLKKYFGVEEA